MNPGFIPFTEEGSRIALEEPEFHQTLRQGTGGNVMELIEGGTGLDSGDRPDLGLQHQLLGRPHLAN